MLRFAALSLIFVGATINYTILQVGLQGTLSTSNWVLAVPDAHVSAHMQS